MKKFLTLAMLALSLTAFAQLKPVADTNIVTVVEEQPEFPGGETALREFLAKNIVYPKNAEEVGIQGTVYVSFIIDETGKVTNVKLLRGIGGGCDEEALRVVQLMPNWTPGKQSGKNVRVQFNLPVKFVLNSTNKLNPDGSRMKRSKSGRKKK